jgi:hypothetical protein
MRKRRLLAILVVVAMTLSFATMFTSGASGELGDFNRLWGGQTSYTYNVEIRLTFGAAINIANGDSLRLNTAGPTPFANGNNVIRVDESVVDGRTADDVFTVTGMRVAQTSNGGARVAVTTTGAPKAAEVGDDSANQLGGNAGWRVTDNSLCDNSAHVVGRLIGATGCVNDACQIIQLATGYTFGTSASITPTGGLFREGSYQHIDVVVTGAFSNANRPGAELKGDWDVESLGIANGLQFVLDRTGQDTIDTHEVFNFSLAPGANNQISLRSITPTGSKASSTLDGNLRDVYQAHLSNVVGLGYGCNTQSVGNVWNGRFVTPTHIEAPYIFGWTGAELTVGLRDAQSGEETRTRSFNSTWDTGASAFVGTLPTGHQRRLVVWTDLTMNASGNVLSIADFDGQIQSTANLELVNASVTNVPTGTNVREVVVRNLTQDMFWNQDFDADMDDTDPNWKPQFARHIFVALINRDTSGTFSVINNQILLHKLDLTVSGNHTTVDLKPGPGAAVRDFGGVTAYEYEIDLRVNFGEQIRFGASGMPWLGLPCSTPAVSENHLTNSPFRVIGPAIRGLGAFGSGIFTIISTSANWLENGNEGDGIDDEDSVGNFLSALTGNTHEALLTTTQLDAALAILSHASNINKASATTAGAILDWDTEFWENAALETLLQNNIKAFLNDASTWDGVGRTLSPTGETAVETLVTTVLAANKGGIQTLFATELNKLNVDRVGATLSFNTAGENINRPVTDLQGGTILSVFDDARGEIVPFIVNGVAINNGKYRASGTLGTNTIDWEIVNSISPEAHELSAAVETRTPAASTDGYNGLTLSLKGYFGNAPRTMGVGDWKAADMEIAQGIQLHMAGTTNFSTTDRALREGTFTNLGTVRNFTISNVKATGKETTAGVGANTGNNNFFNERGGVFYGGQETRSNVLNQLVTTHVAALDVGRWEWNKAPYVMNPFETSSLSITFMPGVNPNAGGNWRVGNPGTINAATASNSNRVFMWTDLTLNENGDVYELNELLGNGPAEVEARQNIRITQAPNNRVASASAVVTFNNIPSSFFYNAEYDRSKDPSDDDYVPEFASEVYIAIVDSRMLEARQTILNTGTMVEQGTTEGTANSPRGATSSATAVAEGQFGGIYSAKLSVDGTIPGDIETEIYTIENFADYVKDGKLDLEELLAEKGADYIVASKSALAGLEDDVIVILANGVEYTIIAESIDEDKLNDDGFRLDFTFPTEVEDWDIKDGSIIIVPGQSGLFGFDVEFFFDAEAIEAIDLEEIALYYCVVSETGAATKLNGLTIAYDCDDDDCDCEEEECEVLGVNAVFGSGSFYVISDEMPAYDGDPIITTTTGTAASTTSGTTGTTVSQTTVSVTAACDCGEDDCPDCNPDIDTATTTATDVTTTVTTPASTTTTGGGFKVGDVNADDKLDIMDALEILKFLANLSDNIIEGANAVPGAKDAAMILDPRPSGGADKPTIFDCLEILKYLARLESQLDTLWPRA